MDEIDQNDPVFQAVATTEPDNIGPQLQDNPAPEVAVDRMKGFLRTHAIANRTFEETSRNFEKAFPGVGAPEKSEYDQWLERAPREGLLDLTRAQAARDQPDKTRLYQSLSFPRDIVTSAMYGAAKERFDNGNPTGEDYGVMAHYEVEHARRQAGEQTWGGYLGAKAMELPSQLAGFGVGKVLGKAMTPAALATATGIPAAIGRAAITTAVTPNLGLQAGIQSNIQNNREPFDIRGLATGEGMGIASLLVLHAAGAATDKLVAGAGLPTHVFAAGLSGPFAQQAVDFANYGLGLQSGYGTLQSIMDGKYGEAAKHAAGNFLDFAAFRAMQGQPEKAKAFIDETVKVVNEQAEKGYSARETFGPEPGGKPERASRVEEVAYQTLGVEPNATPEQVEKAWRAAAMRTHPDRGGSPEAFTRAQWAYDYLMGKKASRTPPPEAPPTERPTAPSDRPAEPTVEPPAQTEPAGEAQPPSADMSAGTPVAPGSPVSPPGPQASPEAVTGAALKPEAKPSAPVDRRQNAAQRARVAEMSPEEMRQELLTSKLTDLPNRRAFDEAEPAKAVAMSDADGLKAFNDKFGYEAGDSLLRAKAEALKAAGLEAFHDKGDEFLFRGGSPDEIGAKLERAREILKDSTIEVTMADGSVRKFKGADFSYGTGTDLSQAESGLKAHKSEREARGERARGELRGITEVGPEADQIRPSGAGPERPPAPEDAGASLKPVTDTKAAELFQEALGHSKLTDQQRQVVVSRLMNAAQGLEGDPSFKAVAEELGISRQRIKQIEQKALKAMGYSGSLEELIAKGKPTLEELGRILRDPSQQPMTAKKEVEEGLDKAVEPEGPDIGRLSNFFKDFFTHGNRWEIDRLRALLRKHWFEDAEINAAFAQAGKMPSRGKSGPKGDISLRGSPAQGRALVYDGHLKAAISDLLYPKETADVQQAGQALGLSESYVQRRIAEAYDEAIRVAQGQVGPGETAAEEGHSGDVGDFNPHILAAGFPLPKFITKHFQNRQAPPAPPVRPVTNRRLPPLQNYDELKKIASEPRGAAKLGIVGKILDPRARATTPDQEAFIGYEYSKGIGQSHANRLRSELRADFGKDAFAWKDGKIKLTNGGTLALSDAIETELRFPGTLALTPQQRNFVKQWQSLLDEMEANALAAGRPWTNSEGQPLSKFHFPRTAVETSAGKTVRSHGTEARFFQTEEEGIKSGVKYHQNAIDRAVEEVRQSYHLDAEYRLANDPALGAQSPDQWYQDAMRNNQGRMAGLSAAGRQHYLDRLREKADSLPYTKEQPGAVRQWTVGKIYPDDVAKRLISRFGQKPYDWLTWVENASDALKALKLSADFAVGQIQGAPIAFRDPRAWARAQWQSLRRLATGKGGLDVLLRDPENRQAASLFVQAGGTLGEAPDFLEGTTKGSILSRVPIVGKVEEHFGGSVAAFFDTAKLYLWKAYLAKKPPTSDWASMAETIESTTGMGRSRTIGVEQGQRTLEKLLVVAPSYYRSFLNQMGDLWGGRRASRIETARVLGSFLVGSAALAAASMKSAGMDDDEIIERFDPSHPRFLMVKATLPDGEEQEIGFGGLHKSVLKLTGQFVRWSSEGMPVDARHRNPLVRFASSKEGFILRLLSEISSEKDFRGRPQSMSEAVLQSLLPSSLDKLIDTGEPSQKVAGVGAELIGLQSYPEPKPKRHSRK